MVNDEMMKWEKNKKAKIKGQGACKIEMLSLRWFFAPTCKQVDFVENLSPGHNALLALKLHVKGRIWICPNQKLIKDFVQYFPSGCNLIGAHFKTRIFSFQHRDIPHGI